MGKTKQNLWTKFGGKEFFARMAENAKNDGEGNEISKTYATKDVATTSADGLLSKTDKEKLDGIAAGAQVNTIQTISANGTALEISNKNVDIPLATNEVDGLLPHGKFPLIPPAPVDADGPDQVYSFDEPNGMSWQTIVKDYLGNMVLDQQGNPVTGEDGSPVFSEDSIRLWLSYKGTEFGARRAYDDHTGANIHDSIEARTTLAQVTAAIESALANYGGFKVVDTLVDGHPDVQDPSERFIYLYKDPRGPEADPYTEWIYTVDNEWDVIGTTYVDLSPYYTSVEVESRLDTKVDKVTGKGLSTNDYTTEDKNKLTGIESGAQANIIESVKVAGSALAIDSKSVNVPEAGGSAGAWVKGVVSGEDKTRWNSWNGAYYDIPIEEGVLPESYTRLSLLNMPNTGTTGIVIPFTGNRAPYNTNSITVSVECTYESIDGGGIWIVWHQSNGNSIYLGENSSKRDGVWVIPLALNNSVIGEYPGLIILDDWENKDVTLTVEGNVIKWNNLQGTLPVETDMELDYICIGSKPFGNRAFPMKIKSIALSMSGNTFFYGVPAKRSSDDTEGIFDYIENEFIAL